jgi:hypothetical protein
VKPPGLVAIDPGVYACGVASFEDGFLVAAALIKVARAEGREARAAEAAAAAWAVVEWCLGRDVGELAVEWPRVYAGQIRRGESRADPNDLLPLAGVDAAVAAVFGGMRVSSYAPSEWKGQMPKDVCRRRIASRLTLAEEHILEEAARTAGGGGHNVWDAVGVGLHHLGRLTPRTRRSRDRDCG